MNRTLEEILNTPVEFKEGMRVFSLISFQFGFVAEYSGSRVNYPIDLCDDNGDNLGEVYTGKGHFRICSKKRHLLTEQEAYELFPSLKPRVYEYQVVYRFKSTFYFSEIFCISKEEFKEKYTNEGFVFVELYQPSKRERKS